MWTRWPAPGMSGPSGRPPTPRGPARDRPPPRGCSRCRAPGWSGWAGQHALEHRDDLLRPGSGWPSGVQWRHGRRFIRASAKRVAASGSSGNCARHLPHGVGIGAIERGAVGRGVGRVAHRQGLDVPPAPAESPSRRAPAPSRSPPRHRARARRRWGCCSSSRGQRDAPVAHRTVAIESGRLAEGALRFDVIEAVHEAEPLIEVRLGPGRGGGDFLRVRPEVVEEGRRRGIARRRVPMIRRARRARRQRHQEEREHQTTGTHGPRLLPRLA